MAARENQGYLIAVIILVLFSLALALVAFLGVSGSYEQSGLAEAAKTKENAAKKLAEAESYRGDALAAMIGDVGVAPAELNQAKQNLKQLSGDRSISQDLQNLISEILKDVENAEQAFAVDTGSPVSGSDDDVSEATLRSRISDLIALVDRLRKDNNVQRGVTETADRKAQEEIKQAQETLASNQKELEDLRAKLQQEKENSLVKENKLKQEVEAEKKVTAELTRKNQEITQTKDAEIRVLADQNQNLLADNENLKIRLNRYENNFFENPDGQVVRVTPATKSVFIDVTQADGVRLNQTFSVYDQTVTDFETATPKGKIVVTQVNQANSEARVISQDTTNPILRDDYILTPTWDPGIDSQLALAGLFDLDGDDADDTERLIRLIEKNGGKVVVRHDLDGNITGKMHPGIRYLVTGNKSFVGGDDVNAGALIDAKEKLVNSAEQNTIQIIDLPKLLSQMGFRSRPRTRQYEFPAGGFAPRSPAGSGTRNDGSGTKGSGDKGSDTRNDGSGLR